MQTTFSFLAIFGLISTALPDSLYSQWKEAYDRRHQPDLAHEHLFNLGWSPIRATKGQPLPLPQSFKQFTEQPPLTIAPFQFEIIPIGYNCDILNFAVERYFKFIMMGEHAGGGWPLGRSHSASSPRNSPHSSVLCESRPYFLHKLFVDVASPCGGGIFPTETSNESYSLEVLSFGAVIKAEQIWGALRALETFSQLVYTDAGCLQVVQTQIEDFPRFAYRGLLLDTSRHFVSKDILLRSLDAMSFAKFNVFHWHIVDDESFPYQSTTYPNLTTKGAFDPVSHVYSQDDVAEIIEHARLRGIRVIPEFDSPGHSMSWGKGLPELLTPCYKDGKPDGALGPIDPSKNSTFEILKKLAEEWKRVFPDKYIHLGGDEVSFGCWQSNPKIAAFMATIKIKSYGELENYYLQKLLDIVAGLGMGYQVWQDPLNNGVKLKAGTVVQIWLGSGDRMKKYLSEVTTAGYKAVLSSCWYLNYLNDPYGWGYISNYYSCDPQNFNGTKQQKKLVLGGEATMWGEYTDSTNVLSNTWPTAAIVGERLWSSQTTTDVNHLMRRLFEMQCRLLHRGVPATPITGPGFCDREWTAL